MSHFTILSIINLRSAPMNRYVVNGIGRKTREDDRNVFDLSVPICY